MRKTRFIENCRSYHLISRLYPPAVRLLAKRGAMRGAHQAFFLDDDEKTRAVELLRRVEEFSGVIVLALLEPIPIIRSRLSRGIA